jgi:hypothetical protein
MIKGGSGWSVCANGAIARRVIPDIRLGQESDFYVLISKPEGGVPGHDAFGQLTQQAW